MAVSPQGMSVQTAYRHYRDGRLLVNRRYQRKLVWTVAEKERLIDSILQGYPIPLFLLAEIQTDGDSVFEIIDGMQRLNALFGFIENGFLWQGRCFDLKEFARARQLSDAGIFEPCPDDVPRISDKQCSNFLDYQLAVTIFPGEKSERITDIFGRINAGGKQLSDQERRQAGVVSPFADIVRQLAAEIRGDVSKEQLLLIDMPSISIETAKNVHGYTLRAEEIFWCHQGILRTVNLRDSEDEQMIADITASIVNGSPVEASGDFLDRLYDPGREEANSVNSAIAAYPRDRLEHELRSVFSLVREIIEASGNERFSFRKTVYEKPTSNPLKQTFFAIFMAVHDLVFKQGCLPTDHVAIMKSLTNVSGKIDIGQKHIKTDDRLKNIKIVKGLISDQFAKGDVASLGHGVGMVFDFENSLRRSKTETPRYEFKQGIVSLGVDRKVDDAHVSHIIDTISAIANVGPGADGFLYIGIADKEADAQRIKALDNVEPILFEHLYLVGIEREAKILGLNLDKYVRLLSDRISASKLSEPLKTQVLTSIDVLSYKGMSVVRMRVPEQAQQTFVGGECFFRSGSSTLKADAPQTAAIGKLFLKKNT